MVYMENVIDSDKSEAIPLVITPQNEKKLPENEMKEIPLHPSSGPMNHEAERPLEIEELEKEYQNKLIAKEKEIRNLMNQTESLKRLNMELWWLFHRIPKFIRKLFVKEEATFIEDKIL